MKSIEIAITGVSPDALSVSIDYHLEASPIVKKWLADRSVVDGIWSAIHETVEDALRESAGPHEAAAYRSLGLALFQELFKDECDRIRDLAQRASATPDSDRPFVILKIDKSLAYLPFELMYDGKSFLAHSFPLGRILYAEDAEVHRVSPRKEPYSVVVIGDPSEDAAITKDVENEIDAVRHIFKKRRDFALKIAVGNEADQKHILTDLPGATIFHFSGHGVVSDDEHLTGIRLGAGKVLGGYSIKGLQDAPAFAFLNVCTPASQETWKGSLGLIETLLRRGTRACLASLWDLRSKSATFTASRFYAHLLAGMTFGEALRQARMETAEEMGLHDPTWASYTLYGDPRLRLLEKGAEPQIEIPSPKRRSRRPVALSAILLVLAAVILIPMATMKEAPEEPTVATPQEAPGPTSQEVPRTPVQAAVGYLVVESTPRDARILLDGKEVGVTPYTFEVPVGTHEVVLEKAGYKRWEASVEIKESPRTTVKATLQKQR